MFEPLESRQLLNVDWRNPLDSMDVDKDGSASPLDALTLINYINSNGDLGLPPTYDPASPYLDVDGDQSVSPLDVLNEINFINAHGSGIRNLSESSNSLSQESDLVITLGQSAGSRAYRLKLDIALDTSDQSSGMEDLVAVYLVDPSNPSQTLLDRGTNGTALFTTTGKKSEWIPGRVSWDGTYLNVDLSDLSQLSTGLLKVQLINHDRDVQSKLSIIPLSNQIDASRSPESSPPIVSNAFAPGAAIDLSGLASNIALQADVHNIRYSRTDGDYEADVSIVNSGVATGRNVAMVFDSLPNGVTIENASGTTSTGKPYFSLKPSIAMGGLATNDVSESIHVKIQDPQGIPFVLQPSFLSSTNHAPTLGSLPPITLKPGEAMRVPINASDSDGDFLKYDVSSNGSLPPVTVTTDGFLELRPMIEHIGTYVLDVHVSDGAISVTRPLTVNVIADTITTTRVSGQVLKVDGSPIVNMRIEIGNVNGLTQSNGTFQLDLGSGTVASDTVKVRGDLFAGGSVSYPFIAEKIAFLLDHPLAQKLNNVIIRPIYLPAIDSANLVTIDPARDMKLTTNAIPGASLSIKAGSLVDLLGTPYTGKLSITEVPVSLTPAALPANLRPDLVVTIQPGDMVFATPAPMSFPNRSGYLPGTPLNLWAVNPTIGEFEIVGTMVVSADGKTIDTVTGGVRYSSWEFAAPPADQASSGPESYESHPECGNPKKVCPINSSVESYTGAVIESHPLVSYQSQGESHELTLVYDSLRADPRPIVHFRYDAVSYAENKRLVAGASISGDNYSRSLSFFFNDEHQAYAENFWSIPQSGGTIDAAMQFDMRSNSTGVYNYELDTGLLNLYNNGGGSFAKVGSAGATSNKAGTIVHVNSINSPFGAGWGLAGLQYLVVNKSTGTVLLVDGDGSELLFSQGLVSPPGDFSHLVKQSDGTYTRTMKDQTVYAFDTAGRLSTNTDRNNNRTTYAYDSAGHLTSITDPVGLQTTFTYVDGHLQSIKDPANRVTQFSVNSSGNLVQVTDPDSSARRWDYDGNHHQVVEIDKLGNREETYFDFAGRARGSRRADGTEIKITPAEVRGLYPDTSDPNKSPVAIRVGEASSQYTTTNGNTITSNLNHFGQAMSESDSIGPLPKTDYNQNNQVESERDARGNITLYKYDASGNLTSIEDSLSNNGLIANEFTTPGEVHVYKFQGVAGARVAPSALVTNSLGERFMFYAPDGRLLAQYFPSPANDLAPIRLPMDGEYRIEGSITFGIDVGAGHPLVSTYSFQLNFESNAKLLNLSNVNTFDMEPFESKLFKFQATAGQKFYATDTMLDSSVRLFNLDNYELYLNNGPVVLRESGTYLLKAVSRSNQRESNALTATLTSGGSFAVSGLDQLHEGSLAASETLEFKFSGPAGHVVALENFGENDISTAIYDPQGVSLDSPGQEFALPASGEYTVRLINYDASQSHAYQFRILDLETSNYQLINGVSKSVTLKPFRSTFFWFDGALEERIFLDTPRLNSYVETIGPYPVNMVADVGVLLRTARFYVKVTNYDTVVQTSTVTKKTITSTFLPEGTGVSGVAVGDGTPTVYRFQGTKGDRFRYHDLGSTPGGRWYVLGPNNETVFATNSYPLGAGMPDDNVGYLATTGLHSLIFTTHNTGSSGTDIPFHAEWLRQKIDTKPVTLGEVVQGTILRVDDINEYAITLQAGQRIFFDGLSELSNLKTEIYSPAGLALTSNHGYYGPGPYSDFSSIPILETGVYRFSIYGDWGVGFTGDYTFRLLDIAQAQPLNINGTSSYTPQHDRQAHLLTFMGHTGQTLQFNVSSPYSQDYFVVDPFARGTPIRGSSPMELQSDGRYFVVASSDIRPDDPIATVSITTTDISSTPVTNSGLNTLQTGSVGAGEKKSFSFTASQGTRILFDNHNLVDPGIKVTVFDSKDNELLVYRIGQNNFSPSTLTSSDTYHVEIFGESNTSSADYEFRLLDIDAAATPIDLDKVVTASFTSGKTGVHLYKFVSQPGQTFMVDQYQTGWTYGMWSPDGFRTASAPTTTYAGTQIIYAFANGSTLQNYKFRVIDLNAIPDTVDGELIQGVAQPGEAVILRKSLQKGERMVYEVFDSQLVVLTDRYGRFLGRSIEANEFIAPETNSYFFIRDFDGIQNVFPYKLRISIPQSKEQLIDSTGGTSKAPRMEYDSTYHLLSNLIDALGRSTVIDRDAKGNVSKVTQIAGQLGGADDAVTNMTVTSAGLTDLVTDARGMMTDYDYDANGRLTSVVRAKGTSLQTSQVYEYDSAGNITAIVDGNGNRTLYQYDALNRLTKEVSPDPDGAGPLVGLITQYAYDANSNLIQITDALGHSQSFTYDAMHRVIETTDAVGKKTAYKYDKAGNLTRITDALGRVTSIEYDVRNRVASQTDSNGNRTTYQYDADNNLVAIVDALGNKSENAYDARNRITKRTDPTNTSERFEFDPADQLTKQIDRLGRTTILKYDDFGRLISESWKSPTGTVENTVESTYDLDNNLTRIHDNFDDIQFEYDLLGQRIHTSSGGMNGVPATELVESYDLVGNRLIVSDKIGGVAGSTKTTSYDAMNRVVRLVEQGNQIASKRVDLGYDAGGRLAALKRYKDLVGSQVVATTNYSFDSLDQVTQIAHTNSANATLDTYTYEYDVAGQTTQATDGSGTANYQFNKLGELLGATYTQSSKPSETYEYDAVGNRKSSATHGSAYVTDKDNRLTSNGVFNYTYDAEGNLVQSVNKQTGAVRGFEYDHRNRLTRVTDQPSAGSPASQVVTYTYDPLDRRIAMKVDSTPSDTQDGIVTYYVYDGSDVIAEWTDTDGSGPAVPAATMRYFHGPDVDQILAQESAGGSPQWFLADQLGSIRTIIDQQGQVLNELAYDSFGNLISQSNPNIATRYRFAGREFDQATGLNYNRARYYDSTNGRFISQDPIKFAGGDANLYRYVGNNPVDTSDPSGLASKSKGPKLNAIGEFFKRTFEGAQKLQKWGKGIYKKGNDKISKFFGWVDEAQANYDRAQVARNEQNLTQYRWQHSDEYLDQLTNRANEGHCPNPNAQNFHRAGQAVKVVSEPLAQKAHSYTDDSFLGKFLAAKNKAAESINKARGGNK